MKILIIDDEPGLAANLSEFLRSKELGNVSAATSAADAQAIAIAQNGVDLLITGVVMEGGDGFALRETLLESFPSLKTIFLSEYDLSEYQDRMVGCPVLAKPVDYSLLEKVANQMLSVLRATAPKPAPPLPAPLTIETSSPIPSESPSLQTTPVATPRPKPAPVPSPAPRPVEVPPPQPTPVAVPVAKPAPVPSPAPRPVEVPPPQPTPVAVPVAKPAPVPSPAPRPVAAPTPQPTPVAVPVAKPAPVPSPAPRPVAAPTSQPTPAPTPISTPTVTPVSVPSPVPKHSKPHSVAASPKILAGGSTPIVESELPPDELVGRELGNYKIEAKVGEGPQGGIYRAIQTNMGRKVRLYVLAADLASNPEESKRFIGSASAKANVRQAYILAVYEAGQAEGYQFYSCEYLPCNSIHQLTEEGKKLPSKTVYTALKTAGDALAHLSMNQTRHSPVTKKSILIAGPEKIRITNIATNDPDVTPSDPEEIQILGTILLDIFDPSTAGEVPGLQELLERIAAGDPQISNWKALQIAAEAIAPKTHVADAYKLDARERAAIKAVEEAKKRQKRSIIASSLTSLALFAVALSVLYWLVFMRGESYKDFDVMVRIPAGEFIYQDGEKITLPEYWIDEYPVTIGQYAEFLKWVKENPDNLGSISHPKAPKGKTFIPDGWADMDLTPPMPGYYTRAKRWGKYKGAPLDLNSPVFGVDFFDAYSYAKWKGRRLPTEQEWEKAARGTNGKLYPWGNEPNNKNVNSGADFDPNPEKGGDIDGWKRWAPVDAVKGDRSDFGVMGMAGNVSEWTDTWAESAEFGGMEVPVIRGGNWQNPDYRLLRRMTLRMPEQNDMVLGFRTASDTPPSPEEN